MASSCTPCNNPPLNTGNPQIPATGNQRISHLSVLEPAKWSLVSYTHPIGTAQSDPVPACHAALHALQRLPVSHSNRSLRSPLASACMSCV